MREKLEKTIETEIASTKEKRYADKLNAYEYGMELLFKTKKDLDDLKASLSTENNQFKSTADRLAVEILQCGIDYFMAMKDNSRFSESNSLEILNSAKPITSNPEIINRIEDNIEGIRDWVTTQAQHNSQKRTYDFNKLLFNTAFSFMTCDGHIDKKEVNLIRKIAQEELLFEGINIEEELESLVMQINATGKEYLKGYFKLIKDSMLDQEQELLLVKMAANTLYADEKVDYNEMKFFKIFKSLLKVSDSQIREKCPTLSDEFFESDIFSHAYLGQLFDDYFDEIVIPTFEKSVLQNTMNK